MRNIAFGYSTRCNIKCDHCVAAGEEFDLCKMDLDEAKSSIIELAAAGVTGISFTAGEPFVYFEDILELIKICHSLKIYSRMVTNSFWAKNQEQTDRYLADLQQAGLSQLRLSFSRWHQEHVPKENVVRAALSCQQKDLDYFVSFVSDFSAKDDPFEDYLRKNRLKFFPEPLIYSGRARKYLKKPILTDYQDNRCAMNCYLAPDYNLYACCDAGSHFTTTNAFYLGNLKKDSAKTLFTKNDTNPLFHCIRTLGLSSIASYIGIPAREIVTYRKCELCEKLLNNHNSLIQLNTLARSQLQHWHR
ncbi:radical SAM protein [Desulforhopalus sp. IMCC35007]|uniref:radical SAM protein n=1 Tax=Desulforhopalus sp. IMCC35007 TaxID=2569543 RepID=UPI0010AEDC04|nr:radical SAM protein [Desulforhopalus sp. IMCC35007]TKB09396.1 radical SAM protein [Desulforhopalus sp. IMCC35007]